LPLIIGGVVLFAVYQLGHSSGSRTAVDSVDRSNVTYPIPMGGAADQRAPVNTNAVRNNAQPVRHQPIPLEGSLPVNAAPARNNAQSVRHQSIPLESSVSRPVPMVVTREVGPMIAPPANSVYDRSPAGIDPSGMGLMPLQPIEPATVYPTPATRSAFREPTLAPALPSTRPVSAAQTSGAQAVTVHSLDCDCGK